MCLCQYLQRKQRVPPGKENEKEASRSRGVINSRQGQKMKHVETREKNMFQSLGDFIHVFKKPNHHTQHARSVFLQTCK